MNAIQPAGQAEVMRNHPCFDSEAHDRVGRIHLPVARTCNIHCNYCERRICTNLAIQHPGWTASMLSARAAVKLVRSIARSGRKNYVVGIAGPGEPLANNETFEALRLIRDEYPDIIKCVSTNGLLLAEKMPDLLGVGIRALTVTVNAADSGVGKYIYSWVRYNGRTYRGEEAARVLISRQLHGIEKALEAGVAVKVNTILIPGVNDEEVKILASCLNRMGVKLMNIMPLIPSGRMKHQRAPTCAELSEIRQCCEAFVPQFYCCEHCRADVVHLI